jgi:transposase|tara:strand:- start:356 stop:574 length:219 start_codon:yes stop_codon:yes gene_type:complete
MVVVDTFIVSSAAQHFQAPNHMRFGVFFKRWPAEPKETRLKIGSWRGYRTRVEAQYAATMFEQRMRNGWQPK